MPSAGQEGDPAVGLCSRCRHGRVQQSAGGSRFWRCLRGGREPGYLKYPPLPVLGCPGFEADVQEADPRRVSRRRKAVAAERRARS